MRDSFAFGPFAVAAEITRGALSTKATTALAIVTLPIFVVVSIVWNGWTIVTDLHKTIGARRVKAFAAIALLSALIMSCASLSTKADDRLRSLRQLAYDSGYCADDPSSCRERWLHAAALFDRLAVEAHAAGVFMLVSDEEAAAYGKEGRIQAAMERRFAASPVSPLDR